MALPVSLAPEVFVAVCEINPSKLFMGSMVACRPQIEGISLPRSFTHAQNVSREDRQKQRMADTGHISRPFAFFRKKLSTVEFFSLAYWFLTLVFLV